MVAKFAAGKGESMKAGDKKTKAKKRALTPKQQRFCREYLIDMNATQAYIRAGYKVSEKVAGTAGPRLMENVGVAAAIKKALGRKLEKIEITSDAVLQEAAKVAFANMLDYLKIQEDGSVVVNLKDLTRAQAAAIQEVNFEEGADHTADGIIPVRKVRFRLSDKRAALELLGRYLKLFNTETPVQDRRTAKILKDVLDDKITVREAAYKFNILGLPIPEALKIELSKITPEPPEPDLPPAFTDEELEERYQKNLEKQNRQETEWVPERQAEVKALKDDLKDADSFGPDVTV